MQLLNRVKICGITRLEDAQNAISLGAWAIGFIFSRKSPRSISPVEAGRITSLIPKHIRTIGVFVDPTIDEIKQAIQESKIQMVQLHGEEDLSFAEALQFPVIKAFRPRSVEDLEVVTQFQKSSLIEAVLIDAFVEPGPNGQKNLGGTGQLANWTWVKNLAKEGNVILAGGINESNIIRAFQEIPLYAVDLSSGVEDRPGIKNYNQLKKLFGKVRNIK